MSNVSPERDLVLTLAPFNAEWQRPVKVYVAGPITGIPNLNLVAFSEVTDNLRKQQYEVVNPHELCSEKDKPWSYYMRHCVQALSRCDSIYMLAHWERSKGAVWEHRIAQMLEMPVDYQFVG